jgi:opacity protein-like surface antigen
MMRFFVLALSLMPGLPAAQSIDFDQPVTLADLLPESAQLVIDQVTVHLGGIPMTREVLTFTAPGVVHYRGFLDNGAAVKYRRTQQGDGFSESLTINHEVVYSCMMFQHSGRYCR